MILSWRQADLIAIGLIVQHDAVILAVDHPDPVRNGVHQRLQKGLVFLDAAHLQLQVFRHLVERVAEFREFVLPVDPRAAFQMTRCQSPAGVGQAGNRSQHEAVDEPGAAEQGYQQQQAAHAGKAHG